MTVRRNISTVFYLTSNLGAVVGTFIILKIAWMNSDDIVKLANLTNVVGKSSRKIKISKIVVSKSLRKLKN